MVDDNEPDEEEEEEEEEDDDDDDDDDDDECRPACIIAIFVCSSAADGGPLGEAIQKEKKMTLSQRLSLSLLFGLPAQSFSARVPVISVLF